MADITVYRVQHRTFTRHGLPAGPYRFLDHLDEQVGDVVNRLSRAHNDDEHPEPWEEGMSDYHGRLFGFESAASLHRWFAGWLAELSLVGFTAALFQVPYEFVSFGARQVAFDPEEATLLRAVDLMEV
jgi:hypothetical protein